MRGGGSNRLQWLCDILVLAMHDPVAAIPESWDCDLFLFSAPTRERLGARLRESEGRAPARLAAALAAAPLDGSHRLALVAGSDRELTDRLAKGIAALTDTAPSRFNLENGVFYANVDAQPPSLSAVVFPGYGARRATLANELEDWFPSVAAWLQTEAPTSADDESGGLLRLLDDIVRADLAAWRVLAEAGVAPAALVGHSFGENAALVAAGIIDPRGVRHVLSSVARASGRAAQDSGIGMLALTARSRPLLDEIMASAPGRLAISLDNCPQQVVVCGDAPALADLEARVKARGDIVFRLEGLTVPTHTPFFPVTLHTLRDAYADVELRGARVPLWSCATARPLPADPELARDVLARQWLSPVRFRETVHALHDAGVRTFIEAGPAGFLTGFIRDTLRGRAMTAVPLHIERPSTIRQLQTALALLFSLGVAPDAGWLYRARRAPSAEHEHVGASASPVVRSPAVVPEPAREMLAIILREVAALVGFNQADADPDALDGRRGFFDLGLTSIGVIELVAALERALKTSLSDTLPFDYPSPESLARHLAVEDAGRRIATRRTAQHDDDVSADQPPPKAPAVRRSHAKAEASPAKAREAIAIVGMGCRLPGGAVSPAAFWELLARGDHAVTGVPSVRWDPAAFEQYLKPEDRPRSRFGAFLEDVRGFDAGFFGISPREAATLDPQQRLLLEVAWEALEDAAIIPQSLAGSATGVFVGISSADYAQRMSPRERLATRGYIGTGNASSTAAGRVSFVLGLQGPSMSIDTACSSSLVALHLAVRSLRHGECDAALAAGVNVIVNPETTILLSNARALSPRGTCSTFDADADGYVRAEGCGMVVLKRLADAVEAGDRILALVRGTAVNHAGHTSGLTVPSGPAQRDLIERALEDAAVSPADVSFIETHGTGTALGDPIEVGALGQVFGTRAGRLPIGAVKTNIGHLEAGAGIAGLLKVVLQLQHHQLAPTLHLRTPNPRIDWAHLPFDVVTSLRPWEGPRRLAGLSSFGISGTNAHAIIDEAPTSTSESASDGPRILALSAGSVRALRESASSVAIAMMGAAPLLADVACTLNTGRARFPYRAAVVAAAPAAAVAALHDVAADHDRIEVAGKPRIVFLFTGQGSQYPGMAHRLFECEPVFRTAFTQCSDVLQPTLGASLADVCFGADGARLNQTAWTQPALFAVEYALAELWQSWGIVPAAVAGHSVGEYVAACVAGVMTLEDGLHLIAARGALMQSLPVGGGMLAIRASEPEVRRLLAASGAALAIAAVNGPANVVVSGEAIEIERMRSLCESGGTNAMPLTVSHAFHSPLMDPVLQAFGERAATITFRRPHLPMVSNLTGAPADDSIATADYWVAHARKTVRFADGVAHLARQHDTFVEIGPRPVLTGMGREIVTDSKIRWVASLLPHVADDLQVRRALAELWTSGADVDWTALHRVDRGRKISMPTYRFEREPHWVEASLAGTDPGRRATARPDAMPGNRVHLPDDEGRVRFETVLFKTSLEALADTHLFGRASSMPVSGYLTIALNAARELGYGDEPLIEDLEISAPLLIPREGVSVQTVISRQNAGAARGEVFSATAAGSWTAHAAFRIASHSEAPRTSAAAEISPGARTSRADFYRANEKFAAEYSEPLRVLDNVAIDDRAAQGTVRLAPGVDPLPLPVLDAGFQLLRAAHFVQAGRAMADVTRVARCTVRGTVPRDMRITVIRGITWNISSIEIAGAAGGSIVVDIEGIESSGTEVDVGATIGTLASPTDDPPAAFLQRAMAVILRLPRDRPIDPDVPFSRVGLDSLLAMHVSTALQRRFAVTISPATIVQCGSISSLAAEIDRRISDPAPVHPPLASDARHVEGEL